MRMFNESVEDKRGFVVILVGVLEANIFAKDLDSVPALSEV